jgi:hypothetical protein
MRLAEICNTFFDREEFEKSPIDIHSLAINMAIFVCYGTLVTVLARMFGWSLKSSKDATPSVIVLEPFSIYMFGILTTISLALLLAGMMRHRSNVQLRESRFVKIVLAPTINAALSAGVVIAGMLLGVALGFFITMIAVSCGHLFMSWLPGHHFVADDQDLESTRIMFKFFLCLSTEILVTLIAFMVSFTDEQSPLNNGLLMITLLGVFVELWALWRFARPSFWVVVALLTTMLLVVGWSTIRRSRRCSMTQSNQG